MKKILIILIVLFLTGCTATYNLEINDDIFDETLQVDNYDSSTWNSTIGDFANYYDYIRYISTTYTPISYKYINNHLQENKINGIEYYDKELISTSTNHGLKITGSMDEKLFSNSLITKKFFPSFIYEIDNYEITISSGTNVNNLFLYNLLKKITINLTVDSEVIENNASSVNNNIYTWVLTKENYKDMLPLTIRYKKSTTRITNEKNEKLSIEKDNVKYKLIIFCSIIIIASILLIYISTKSKKNNKI